MYVRHWMHIEILDEATVYYKIDKDVIWIYAVLDERQDPDKIRERLT